MTALTQRARDVAGRLKDGPYTVGPASGEIRELSEAAAIISELVERIVGVWQDIETAPKDGTRVLLWGALHGSKFEADKWTRGETSPPCVSLGYFSGGLWQTGTFHSPPAPTAWLPLPQPPSVLGKQEGEW